MRSILTLLVLLSLLGPLAATAPDGRAPVQAMPPHPRLREAIQRGEVILPPALADPALARELGIDQPRSRPFRPDGTTLRSLAVLVDFSDNVHTVTAGFFDTLIFGAPVVGRGSVRDYFAEVSYGAVDVVTVNMPSAIGWKRAPSTYGYYVDYANCLGDYPYNCQKLAEDIVDRVNSVVDFSDYDNDGDGYAEPIMLIHAGPGAEFTGDSRDVWSHSWSLFNSRYLDGVTVSDYVIMPEYWDSVSAATSDMTIGVFVHEMGHGFWGLPDVYDTDYSSQGVGRWSLMAGGSWNGPDSGGWGSDGSSPAWPDAWNRIQMGLISPHWIVGTALGVSIPKVVGSPPPAATVLKLRSTLLEMQEYFLVENRQRTTGSYDEYLPTSGLAIWHVDEAMNVYGKQNDLECSLQPHCLCLDNRHYLLALEQADGDLDLEFGANEGDDGDLFPGSSVNRTFTFATDPESGSWYTCGATCIAVTNISNSGATMTADVQGTCGGEALSVHLPLVLKERIGLRRAPR